MNNNLGFQSVPREMREEIAALIKEGKTLKEALKIASKNKNVTTVTFNRPR